MSVSVNDTLGNVLNGKFSIIARELLPGIAVTMIVLVDDTVMIVLAVIVVLVKKYG